MPSPFPGMDPFIEMQEWEDFHPTAITIIRELLMPNLGTKYVVRVERRVYVEEATGEPDKEKLLIADVAVAEEPTATGLPAEAAGSAAVAPVECMLPAFQERREAHLLIRDRDSLDVVTVLELLSPSNKRPGGEGRAQYLSKREAILSSEAHLVELDLLRGGARLPMRSPLPAGDYYAIISRADRRPRADVYAWTLSQPLPAILIPLRAGDPDVSLDLGAVVKIAYERARYDLSIRYDVPLTPVLNEADAAWVGPLLASLPRTGDSSAPPSSP